VSGEGVMSLLGISKQVLEAVSPDHRDIYAFLEGVLKDAGCSASDTKIQTEMIKMLYDHLDSFVFIVIVEHLPEKHLDAFLTMSVQKRSKAKIAKLVDMYIPNRSKVFAEAFQDFRAVYGCRRFLMSTWVSWSCFKRH
jgi:hypothetical protein